MVWVGPPLFLSPAGSSCGLVLLRKPSTVEPSTVLKPQLEPSSRLCPPSLNRRGCPVLPRHFSPPLILGTRAMTIPPSRRESGIRGRPGVSSGRGENRAQLHSNKRSSTCRSRRRASAVMPGSGSRRLAPRPSPSPRCAQCSTWMRPRCSTGCSPDLERSPPAPAGRRTTRGKKQLITFLREGSRTG